jgi:hypothetical protein
MPRRRLTILAAGKEAGCTSATASGGADSRNHFWRLLPARILRRARRPLEPPHRMGDDGRPARPGAPAEDRHRDDGVGCTYSIFLQIDRIRSAAEFVHPRPSPWRYEGHSASDSTATERSLMGPFRAPALRPVCLVPGSSPSMNVCWFGVWWPGGRWPRRAAASCRSKHQPSRT